MEAERFDKTKKLTEALQKSKALMIDGLGFEDGRQSQEISALIQDREENGLRTIITTNLGPKEINEKYGQKLYSRVRKAIVHCDGEDWRRG